MASCITCGREFRTGVFGTKTDVCPECRASAIDASTGATTSSATWTPPAQVVVARRPPPITKIIVGINVAVFAAMVLSGISLTEPTTQQLLTWGANFGPLSLGTQPWRIFASNYLHIGIIHIALNMWCLWNLGLLAERIFDPWTYVLTYTACGIAGSIASLGLHPMVVGAGASGAIFGLAGALITALYMGKLPIPKHALSPIMRSLVTFAGYNLFFGAVVPGIDNSAHIGGLLAGLALGAALAQTLTSQPEVRHRWRLVIFVVATILLFAAFSLVKQTRGPELPQQEIPTAEDRPLDKPLRAYKKNLSVAVATLKTT